MSENFSNQLTSRVPISLGSERTRAWFKKGSFKVTVARQIRPSLRGGSESTGWVELSGSEELEP